MSSNVKPIKVYGKGGPNPPKVAMILEELGIPHEIIDTQIADTKSPEYLTINPNGRLPSIHDPNTDLTLWESGAIVLYLVDRYDTDHKLSFKSGTDEAYLAQQWLFFQASGQGPYYGQAAWFTKWHPESVPSALERYVKEINRICGVLEGHLQKQNAGAKNDGPWLVGGRCSYVDIAFLPWQLVAAKFLKGPDYTPENFPLVHQWVENVRNRKGVKSVLKNNEQLN